MRYPAIRIFGCTVALVTGLMVDPARADFYTLDGKFACLSAGEASCAGHARDALVPPKTDDPNATTSASTHHDPLLQAPPALTDHKQAKGATPPDSVHDIATRVEAGKPSSEDLHRLRAIARTGDGRAIELLAWCDYFGIGLPRDPVAAYILYGIASLAGIAGASANQAVIYGYVLTPDQRQMVLDIQNDDLDAVTASP